MGERRERRRLRALAYDQNEHVVAPKALLVQQQCIKDPQPVPSSTVDSAQGQGRVVGSAEPVPALPAAQNNIESNSTRQSHSRGLEDLHQKQVTCLRIWQ
ncbi:hypothetical protein WJX77_009316 [Trebouxia sp. C0004]